MGRCLGSPQEVMSRAARMVNEAVETWDGVAGEHATPGGFFRFRVIEFVVLFQW